MEIERQFFSADELLFDEAISATLADQKFAPFRRSADGTQWYRLVRPETIRALPDRSGEIMGGTLNFSRMNHG
jgi:hypothetical protein